MIGRRRFWTDVIVLPVEGGHGVCLDARPLRTPAGRALAVPTAALAAAIAAEWTAIEGEIQPDQLPFTRTANSAIDRVAADPAPVVDALAAYGETDLLCYRAGDPAELQSRQAAEWDPWLDWARRALAAPLFAVTGIMHHPQPEASLEALRAAVAAHDPFALTALSELVTLSGSLVLALAVSHRALDGETAWELSRLEEIWQAEHWGEDHEAAAAASRRRLDFLRAETLLRMLGGER